MIRAGWMAVVLNPRASVQKGGESSSFIDFKEQKRPLRLLTQDPNVAFG
jgi:hypothetical protein